MPISECGGVGVCRKKHTRLETTTSSIRKNDTCSGSLAIESSTKQESTPCRWQRSQSRKGQADEPHLDIHSTQGLGDHEAQQVGEEGGQAVCSHHGKELPLALWTSRRPGLKLAVVKILCRLAAAWALTGLGRGGVG